jgi:hypothetical protein
MKISTLLAAMVMAVSGQAFAAPVSSLFGPGAVNLEDDDVERVFRPNDAGGFDPVTVPGTLQEGDIVFGLFDITTVNGTQLNGINTELTGLYLVQVADITGVGVGDTIAETVTFAPVGSSATWNTITGIDPTVADDGADHAALDATNLVAFFWEEDGSPLENDNILQNDFDTSLAQVIDGVFRLALDMGDGSATNVQTDLATVASGIPGITTQGNFAFNFAVQDQNFPGFNFASFNGSGTNLTPFATSEAAIASDFQAVLQQQVPEPSTIALLGLGLLGAGFTSRRQKR